MTKWIPFLLAVAALTAATPDPKAEKEVRAAMETYRQAMLQRDAGALAKVLSDDLIYTHSSNKHQDKAAVLDSLKGESATVAIDFKDLKVRVYGNTAVVVGDIDFTDRDAKGVRTMHQLNVLHVWVKGPQGWQMVARQAVRYPDPAPAAKK